VYIGFSNPTIFLIFCLSNPTRNCNFSHFHCNFIKRSIYN
jgi:hypothetical protein